MTISSFTVTVKHPYGMRQTEVKDFIKTAVMSEKGHYLPEQLESEVEFVEIKSQRKTQPK